MAKYYVDFVGLNTFIYEPVGWETTEVPGFGLINTEMVMVPPNQFSSDGGVARKFANHTV